MMGLVIRSTGSWYSVKTDDGVKEARIRGKFKLEDKKITNPIAVGDRVTLSEHQPNEWIIEKINDRSNYVIRQSPKKKYHSHLIAANIDQALLVATLKLPRTSLGFIDRFFVSLETFRIPGILYFNKTDLLSKEEEEEIDFLMYRYQKIGYTCLKGSFLHDQNQDKLTHILNGKLTLISGHSGAGKSTLVNQLEPRAEQKVGDLSGFANKGIHTTTFAEMFAVGQETMIIDTPGIKELGLAEIAPEELAHYFPEMRAYLGECRFHNCIHVNEPGCKVKEAVEDGSISLERYESYLSMLEADDNRR